MQEKSEKKILYLFFYFSLKKNDKLFATFFTFLSMQFFNVGESLFQPETVLYINQGKYDISICF